MARKKEKAEEIPAQEITPGMEPPESLDPEPETPEILDPTPEYASAQDVLAQFKPMYARKRALTRVVKMDRPFICHTMEGKVTGKAGDFLAIGVKGEVYPIDAEVFAESYELVIPSGR